MIRIGLFLIALAWSCSDSQDSSISGKSEIGNDKIPVTTQAILEGTKVTLSLQANSGFGIQIEAPNQLKGEGLDGLKVLSSDLSFRGNPRSDKPEYYANLNPMEFQVEGKGSIHLTGKIFYCDYSKNICLPGKLDRKLSL